MAAATLPRPSRRLAAAGLEPLPPALRAEHQHQRLLDAATAVFAERGYNAATIEQLVAAARIGVGSFYELFAGKRDCFEAALERALAAAGERLDTALAATPAWPEQVRTCLAALIEWTDAEPAQARLALVEAQVAGPVALGRYQACLERLGRLLAGGRALTPHGSELPRTLEPILIGGVAWVLGERAAAKRPPLAATQLAAELAEFLLTPYDQAGPPVTGGAA